jgi:pimeloyl-ACP methyl ester carboxylesterase
VLRRWLPRVLLGAIVVLVVAVVGVLAWMAIPQPLLPEAEAALVSTPTVTFEDEGDWLAYRPTAGAASAGVILVPSAKVSAEAYAPTAQAIAEAGYAAFVLRLPLNFAPLGIGRTDEVRAAEPGVERWALWGHSLGGAFAATHLLERPGAYAGLALCGAYPNGDVSAEPIEAVSVYGTLDGGAERITSPETRAQLPADTVFVAIEGGNHEGCGWYTGQLGDPPATIPRAEQQAAIVEATVAMLEAIAGAP